MFSHNTSTFPSSRQKVSWGVTAAGSTDDSSSGVSAMVKSERVAMLMDGDCVAGDSGAVSVSGARAGSVGEGRVTCGSGSMLGSPRDVTMGVALGSSLPAPADFAFVDENMGEGGRPSQPRSRSSSTSFKFSSFAASSHRAKYTYLHQSAFYRVRTVVVLEKLEAAVDH